VAKDHGEAVKWWRKAADQGNADAQRAMGRCYAKGFGVETDNIVALKWYRKAAQQGDREARNIADDLQKKIEAKPAEKKPGE
jgi:TPR repeat protein